MTKMSQAYTYIRVIKAAPHTGGLDLASLVV